MASRKRFEGGRPEKATCQRQVPEQEAEAERRGSKRVPKARRRRRAT